MATWEQDVIGEVLAGNRSAYGVLVRQYEDPIRHSVTQLLGDSESAREITQDAFLAAFENLDSFDSSRSFFSWLYRIAWNRALNRSHREQRMCPLGDHDPKAQAPTQEEGLLKQERIAALDTAVLGLQPKYSILVILRHYMEFSYREIAEILDLPTSTVRSRIYTARRLLAEALR